jgi:hypothetical protein
MCFRIVFFALSKPALNASAGFERAKNTMRKHMGSV